MTYNTIVNPTTGRKVGVNSVLGRKIIKKYIERIGTIKTGGTNWLSNGPQTMVMCYYCHQRPAMTNCHVPDHPDEYGILTYHPICESCVRRDRCK